MNFNKFMVSVVLVAKNMSVGAQHLVVIFFLLLFAFTTSFSMVWGASAPNDFLYDTTCVRGRKTRLVVGAPAGGADGTGGFSDACGREAIGM